MWRLIPPTEVAKAVWAAYGGDKIHWYVPSELEEFDKFITANPEQARDMMAAAGLFNRDSE